MLLVFVWRVSGHQQTMTFHVVDNFVLFSIVLRATFLKLSMIGPPVLMPRKIETYKKFIHLNTQLFLKYFGI